MCLSWSCNLHYSKAYLSVLLKKRLYKVPIYTINNTYVTFGFAQIGRQGAVQTLHNTYAISSSEGPE